MCESLMLVSINNSVFVEILVYRMDRNQITAITARLWRREVSQATQNIVAPRHPRRKLRKSFLIVSS